MAEIFANEGYNTAAFVNMSMLSEQNLGQGFQTRVESFLNIQNYLSERISYKLKKPDGTTQEGKIDASGEISIQKSAAGVDEIILPEKKGATIRIKR